MFGWQYELAPAPEPATRTARANRQSRFFPKAPRRPMLALSAMAYGARLARWCSRWCLSWARQTRLNPLPIPIISLCTVPMPSCATDPGDRQGRCSWRRRGDLDSKEERPGRRCRPRRLPRGDDHGYVPADPPLSLSLGGLSAAAVTLGRPSARPSARPPVRPNVRPSVRPNVESGRVRSESGSGPSRSDGRTVYWSTKTLTLVALISPSSTPNRTIPYGPL